MSSNKETPVVDLSQIPEDVQELNRIMGEFGDFHQVLLLAQFPGRASKIVDKLINHVYDMYKQTHSQYMEHPWVIEQTKAKEQEEG